MSLNIYTLSPKECIDSLLADKFILYLERGYAAAPFCSGLAVGHDSKVERAYNALSSRDGRHELYTQTARSIKTNYTGPDTFNHGTMPWSIDTWPVARSGYSATSRVRSWVSRESSSTASIFVPAVRVLLSTEQFVQIMSYLDMEKRDLMIANIVPIFDSIVRSLKTNLKTQPTREKEKMSLFKHSTVDSAIDANKQAVKLAAKLSVGKAANSVLLSKVVGKFPWYARLFGKAKEFEKNPLAKLGSAELVMVLSKHFAPDNAKLQYLSEAMLQEAMIDVAVNSSQFNSLIDELTSLVPDLTSIKDKE